MKKKKVLFAACILLAGCNSSPNEESTKGIVTDASMNTVTIVTEKSDTLSFSTMNADKTNLKGLLLGDTVEIYYGGNYKSGMEADSIKTVAKVAEDDYSRFFKNGFRVEAVDGKEPGIYVVFSDDSMKAELFSPENENKEILEQRSLPSGEHVWNIEDDDTKNLRFAEGCWTISQRGKLVYKQAQSDNDTSLGEWQESYFEGTLPAADCPGIKYQLSIRNREHSGDGYFMLRLTYIEGEDGKDITFTSLGKRYTMRGTATDNNATVWQLKTNNNKETYNFLYDDAKKTLTLLTQDLKTIDSGLNYTLNKK